MLKIILLLIIDKEKSRKFKLEFISISSANWISLWKELRSKRNMFNWRSVHVQMQNIGFIHDD